jgi:hypothetical protein
MLNCTYELNNEDISLLKCGATSFEAFSGNEGHRNKKTSACLSGAGPIPTGKYYMIDRRSGGLLGPIRDLFNDKDEWIALYAIDKKIDDSVMCNNIKRGQFRIHPKGPMAISNGCIVITTQKDFNFFKSILGNTKKEKIPGSNVETYGVLTVK